MPRWYRRSAIQDRRRKKIEPESDIQKTRNKPASRNHEKRKEIKTRKIKKKIFVVQCEDPRAYLHYGAIYCLVCV
jgi:hypothetical protein